MAFVTRRIGPCLTPHLSTLLGAPLRYRPVVLRHDKVEAIVGWGLKGVFARDAAWAARHGLPYLALEDGFLRSVRPGDGDAALSVSIDPVGVYYDAHRPSKLEQDIARARSIDELARGERIVAAWRDGRLSKYNHAREMPPPASGPFVLVVDQTAGDASIAYGMASEHSFLRMLEAALDEHPGLPVVLKVHPDVVEGRKRAHFGALTPGQASRVTLLATNAHPPALLEAAAAVYVVTSQMGFEALMWRKPVRCFGMPFYAGWGLTGDELPAPERRRGARAVTLAGLAHAALVDYPRYIDPETFERCEAERVMDWMALQRRMRERFAPQVQAAGFSQWKQPSVRAFLGGSTVRFVEQAQPLAEGEARAVWGRGEPVPGLLRLEDGFLRSVGLGANLVQPLSWVIDRSGMYYDAGAPSDLEHLLEAGGFDAALQERARALRQAIVARGITKYNVGAGAWQRPPGSRRVVLVPGQVENDASIAFGAPAVRTNLGLLEAVRALRPDAWIVYKPHPDVLAGKRPGEAGMDEARRWCDEVVTDVPIHRLFEQVDELHVLTSLAGFEALLRGRPVVCHGLPFYAGWGLTEDRHACPRRTRRLTLDELVAGALIAYPTYVSRTTGAFTTPERVLHELAHWQASAPPADPWWLRALRRLKRWRARLRRP
ncbi:capsular polysaccharide biosynthesis protein [uncultured Piscinibacter sp.]|uniref:capsular polysaccharide biosynthesis protein n=1 Tax=uncultured Piscinibacter sp. TaxID=1131835 RepID=UPI00262E5EFD|nr:capsular polysaccharide biosynthesis protein [uncultured Piscinibacter sp.]